MKNLEVDEDEEVKVLVKKPIDRGIIEDFNYS